MTGWASLRSRIIRVDDALLRVEDAFIALLLAASFIIMIANVFWRYVLGQAFLWSLEISIIIFSFLVFFGASASFPHHQHMRVDALIRVLPAPVRAVVGAVAVAATFVIIAVLLTMGIEYCIAVADDRTPEFGISFAIWYGAMPASMVSSLVHVLRLVVDEGPADALRSSAETELG
jgi:TRAP-type C4-dicarboxylate transport system permease small subunit